MLHYGFCMSVPPNNNQIARFGVFELDFSTGELRKSGVKLRLQGQPIQVLTLLLERAGDVVTREELRQKLWASDTFVDFDHSLNTAINKVREALGDSASSPRFVETLARRGYRFIAPVQVPVPAPPADGVAFPSAGAASGNHGQPVAREPVPASAPLHPQLEVPIPRRELTRGLFALIQVMYLCFYLPALFRLHSVQRVAESFLPGWGASALVAASFISSLMVVARTSRAPRKMKGKPRTLLTWLG